MTFKKKKGKKKMKVVGVRGRGAVAVNRDLKRQTADVISIPGMFHFGRVRFWSRAVRTFPSSCTDAITSKPFKRTEIIPFHSFLFFLHQEPAIVD